MQITELNTKQELYDILLDSSLCLSKIYVIRCNNYFKIGHSVNPIARIEGLQIGNPYQLELVFVAPTTDHRKMEKELHNKFKHLCIRGEWFEMQENDFVDFEKYFRDICLPQNKNV